MWFKSGYREKLHRKYRAWHYEKAKWDRDLNFLPKDSEYINCLYQIMGGNVANENES